ncbi:unnamed protein product [Prorocentrum cordatum]|uniref:Uncharacterized protein n=1 Tax=Prorocentrum cordatum TaxID=2364126 RepID=A0ABN9VKJ9_9DINO|nr:unnamed protein product [Polarella glacialis]
MASDWPEGAACDAARGRAATWAQWREEGRRSFCEGRSEGSSCGEGTAAESSAGPAQEGAVERWLGPPLNFLPRSIEPNELADYRAKYQAFRAGKAEGARGEISRLCPSKVDLEAPWREHDRQRHAHLMQRVGSFGRRGARLVPLIPLKLSASSAAMSALDAASEYHQRTLDELEQLELEEEDGDEALNQTAAPTRSVTEPVPGSPMKPRIASPVPRLSCAANPGDGADGDGMFGTPLSWGASGLCVQSKHGVGLLVQIVLSLACLLPCLLGAERLWWRSLWLPAAYALWIWLSTLRRGVKLYGCQQLIWEHVPWGDLLTQVLRMERLVNEGCVPRWFPELAAAMYTLIALQAALGRSLGGPSGAEGRRMSISKKKRGTSTPTPQRHDYSCWGADTESVSDCIMVRHAAFTTLVSFYTCLFVMAVCNRNAPSLFSYVERSVDSNRASWRKRQRYRLQSVALSLAWTLTTFGVYMGLIQDSQSLLARSVFLASAPWNFVLQFTLLRHMLLSVLLYLEAVKARAAALAYCDEERVLPFTSAHAIYVWFSVRRNVMAMNEVAYQHVAPIFAASLLTAAGCSVWVVTQLAQRGLSVFALTNQGGLSLMVVASACISCIFVSSFLNRLLDIGKLEEAHARQLRIAHLRLEHSRCRLARARRSAESAWRQAGGCSPIREDAASLLEDHADESANDIDEAIAMAEKVVLHLETHDPKPAIFGVEIGSKSFQVVYAALLSNSWYLMVWGILIPLMSQEDDKE